MALINPPFFLSEIRGRLGDYVFSRNRGGAYVRTVGSYTDTGSASQLELRNYLTKAVEFWQHMTDDCKLAWTAAAPEWFKKMNHFRKGTHIGYNYFVSSFIRKCVSDGFPFNSICENGTFDSDAHWNNYGTSAVISGGKLNFSSGLGTGFKFQSQGSHTTTAGLFYYISFSISNYTSGSFYPYIGSGITPGFNTSGFNEFYNQDTGSSTTIYALGNSTTALSVDDFVVIDVNQYPSDIL